MKIFVVNDGSPELLGLQVASFRKYLQDDFEFFVVNNPAIAVDQRKANEVLDVCRSLSIQVIAPQRNKDLEKEFMQVRNHPAFNDRGTSCEGTMGWLEGSIGRYASYEGPVNYGLTWTWEKVVSKEQGPIGFFHSDVFLMEPIKFTDYLQEHSLCFHPQSRGSAIYAWEAFVLADIPKLPSPETMRWFPVIIDGKQTDTGGCTHFYLAAHPEIKILHVGQQMHDSDSTVDFQPARYGIFKLGNKKVLHYMSGSRWLQRDNEYHDKKFSWAQKLIGVTGSR